MASNNEGIGVVTAVQYDREVAAKVEAEKAKEATAKAPARTDKKEN